MCSVTHRCYPVQRLLILRINAAVKGRAGRRYYRTTLLGIVAMGALVWVAVDQFEISPQEFTELVLATVLLALVVIVAAAGVALLWVALRTLLRRRQP